MIFRTVATTTTRKMISAHGQDARTPPKLYYSGIRFLPNDSGGPKDAEIATSIAETEHQPEAASAPRPAQPQKSAGPLPRAR